MSSLSISSQNKTINSNQQIQKTSFSSCLKTAIKVSCIVLKIIAAVAFMGVGSVTVFTSSIGGFIACPLWAAIPAGLALAYIGERAAESAFKDVRQLLA